MKTNIPVDCKVCGDPIELPRYNGKQVHDECIPVYNRMIAKRHYEKRGKVQQREWYEKRKSAGLCVQCGSIAEEGKTLCQRHLDSKKGKKARRDLRAEILSQARYRAKRNNLPFNLTLEDIVIPEKCPALGVELKQERKGKRTNNSPSLDRTIPELGYVKGNVRVISWLANNIKGNYLPDDVIKVGNWMKEVMNQ